MKTAILGLLTGQGPLVPALALAIVAALVFLVTARLARQADTIAERTGLGRLWIGTVLLAATTSLPELLTNVNAGLLDEPDIGLLTIFVLAICLSLALMAILSRARRRPGPVLVESVLIVVTYGLGAWLLARAGS